MSSIIQKLIKENLAELISGWEAEQKKHISSNLISDAELEGQMKEFLKVFQQGMAKDNYEDLQAPEWKNTRDFLGSISHSRGIQGFTPTETAIFILALKRCLLQTLDKQSGQSDISLKDVNRLTDLLDRLGLYTMEAHQQAREQVIIRQQQDMLELSSPVVELAPGIIALPMIGTLDSSRTEVVMSNLLQKIVDASASIAIIDITGVPTVDTLVAQHLLKTITAARLMGAECIISGIRPQIASTIVHLGVELNDVATKASLASALSLAFAKTGHSIVKNSGVK